MKNLIRYNYPNIELKDYKNLDKYRFMLRYISGKTALEFYDGFRIERMINLHFNQNILRNNLHSQEMYL